MLNDRSETMLVSDHRLNISIIIIAMSLKDFNIALLISDKN